MAQDWDIKPRAEACRACENAFEDGQVCHSALEFLEQGYTRTDYCAACWQEHQASCAPYSTWQGVFRLPPAAPEGPLKKETAETLLRKLMEEEDERHRNVVYILAVMLERKRELVERDVHTLEDGTTIRVYEHRRTGETFVVPDPGLKLDKLEQVQRQVLAMLDPKPERAAEEPEPEETPAAETGGPDPSAGDVRDGFYSAAPSR
jgi:hypothetical protein